MSAVWTESDVELLRCNYTSMGTQIPELRCKFTVRGIRAKANRLGLSCDRVNAGLVWSESEVQILRDKYYDCGANIPELLQSHSMDSIQKKAASLGIKTKVTSSGVAWTLEDITLLREKYVEFGCKIPELLLRHSTGSIYAEAAKLGLFRHGTDMGIWTESEIKILREQYPIKGSNIPELLVRYTRRQIKNAAYRCGVRFSEPFEVQWTEHDVAILRRMYPSCGTKIPELLGVYTRKQIKNAAYRYGVRTELHYRDKKCCRWTDAEVRILCEKYPLVGTNIPELLCCRTTESIKKKAQAMKLCLVHSYLSELPYAPGWYCITCSVCGDTFLVQEGELRNFNHNWHISIPVVPDGWSL